jgi:hypothetical protein
VYKYDWADITKPEPWSTKPGDWLQQTINRSIHLQALMSSGIRSRSQQLRQSHLQQPHYSQSSGQQLIKMTLLLLPREIRDDIFINVLSSRTGHIHISIRQNSSSATFNLLEVLHVKGQITDSLRMQGSPLETQYLFLLSRLPFSRFEMPRHQARCQNSTRPARDGPTQPRKVDRDGSFEYGDLSKIWSLEEHHAEAC